MVEYRLPNETQVCSCCSGAFFEKISKSAQPVTNQIKATSSNSSDILQNSQTIVRVVNELSHIANAYANRSSNVETSMKCTRYCRTSNFSKLAFTRVVRVNWKVEKLIE